MVRERGGGRYLGNKPWGCQLCPWTVVFTDPDLLQNLEMSGEIFEHGRYTLDDNFTWVSCRTFGLLASPLALVQDHAPARFFIHLIAF